MRDALPDRRIVLVPETRGVSLAPRMVLEPPAGTATGRIDRAFPAVEAHRFADAWVDARSSSVIVSQAHVLSDWAYDNIRSGRVKGSSVLAHDRHDALHRLPRRPRVIEQGIHLGGYHSQNWYHWVAEILPRLSLLDRLPEDWHAMPLLVPTGGRWPGSFREVLDVLVGDHPRHDLDQSDPVLVRDLVVIDDLILHTPGFGGDGGPRTDLELMSVEGMQRYRSLLVERLGLTGVVEPGLRIFIDREHDPERAYNRDEIAQVAQQHGFRPIIAEKYSFREQADLFSRAEIVIGANGAGWTNVLFSSTGSRGLCWLVRDGLGGPWFRNLGFVSGMEISYLEVEPRGEGNPLKVDYWVDPEQFAAGLQEVIAGK